MESFALLGEKDHILTVGLDSSQHMALHKRGRLGPTDAKPLRFVPAAGPKRTPL